ncbi:uncharacterized protein LOC124289991 [Haliotis rubra]|uniref:uncharacterized protein LOC124289991 n=1 Tax=Haliotis rubra TaxID=36100 RepID=UPI001EE622C3|nr:uncharacterized protein LOC124289991 [Haliotis rubra]
MSALTHTVIFGLILISACESEKLFKSMDVNTPSHVATITNFSVNNEARSEVYFVTAKFNKNNVFPTFMVLETDSVDQKCDTKAIWSGSAQPGQASCFDHEDDIMVCFSTISNLTIAADAKYSLFGLNCQGTTARQGMVMHVIVAQKGAKPEDKYNPVPAPNPADHYDITPVIPIAIVMGIISCIFIVCFCYRSRDCFSRKSSIRKGKKSGSTEEAKAFIKEEREAVA